MHTPSINSHLRYRFKLWSTYEQHTPRSFALFSRAGVNEWGRESGRDWDGDWEREWDAKGKESRSREEKTKPEVKCNWWKKEKNHEMLKCLLITRKSKFNDADRIEVDCRVILVNALMPCDAFKELVHTHTHRTVNREQNTIIAHMRRVSDRASEWSRD